MNAIADDPSLPNNNENDDVKNQSPQERPDSESLNPHADKFNDPRANFSRRGILIGVAVGVIATIAAMGSIYARRTRLEKSTEYWGPTTIQALQLAEKITLTPVDTDEIAPINLTAMPGLGHLRRAILDERHYDWDTIEAASAIDDCEGKTIGEKKMPGCITLVLSDPTLERFQPIKLSLNLADGYLGPGDGSSRVRLSEHVRPKLQSYLATIMNVEQLRYDDRNP